MSLNKHVCYVMYVCILAQFSKYKPPRGLYLEGWFNYGGGDLCFKIDWASLIVGSKLTFFALFYFVF